MRKGKSLPFPVFSNTNLRIFVTKHKAAIDHTTRNGGGGGVSEYAHTKRVSGKAGHTTWKCH